MAATLVWINGPFGVGKTATAFELHRRLPGSAVCDPGHVGFGMRPMLSMIAPPTTKATAKASQAIRTPGSAASVSGLAECLI